MKYVMKFLLFIIGLIVVIFLGLLIYLSVTKYEPEAKELLSESVGDTLQVSDSTVYEAMIWNIGYAGLDKSMDFFYDGGEQVRPKESNSKMNLEKIKSTIKELGDSSDFLMLQEVDKKSRRSYNMNQVDEISKIFPEINSQYALNYNVKFVPLPLKEPMGRVESGLLLLSKYQPMNATRHSFPSDFGFPKNLGMLQRCFLVNRYPTTNGKELLVIDTHNSAYDDGSLRKEEMDFFKSFLSDEYGKGNYVLVGGDWNQCPPNLKNQYTTDKFDDVNRIDISTDFLSDDWQWAYDPTVPTNRRVTSPYVQGESRTTVIDFFLLSPNLELIDIKGQHLNFDVSDHNPVKLRFKFK